LRARRPCRVSLRAHAESPLIAGGDHIERLEPLIRLEVACRLALDALPEPPAETEQALRAHVETLCDVTGAELDRISPSWRDSIS
jgi:hypothetical protein